MQASQGSIPGDGSQPRFNSLGIRSHPRFNSLGIRSHPRFNSLGIRSHDSKAIHYFIPSLVALGRGIYISLMIRFLYYNCLGFDLVLWLQHNIIPNTV